MHVDLCIYVYKHVELFNPTLICLNKRERKNKKKKCYLQVCKGKKMVFQVGLLSEDGWHTLFSVVFSLFLSLSLHEIHQLYLKSSISID